MESELAIINHLDSYTILLPVESAKIPQKTQPTLSSSSTNDRNSYLLSISSNIPSDLDMA